MPSRRLSTMSVVRSDTKTDNTVERLLRLVAEQKERINELTSSLRTVAYNALPAPDIAIKFYKYNGGVLDSSSPNLSVVMSKDGLNASALMSAISTAIQDAFVNPGVAPQTFSFYKAATAWSGLTGNAISNSNVTADADWDFGSGALAPEGSANIVNGVPVLYVLTGGGTYYTISEGYGLNPLPAIYGNILGDYDVFRCAYFLSVGATQTSSSQVDAYILSNDDRGDKFIEDLKTLYSGA